MGFIHFAPFRELHILCNTASRSISWGSPLQGIDIREQMEGFSCIFMQEINFWRLEKWF
jgi:hypothetical protein